ncbi:hypothetical protein SEA_SWEATNTEARS_3 [Gordonia phage SweatNTears]|nr:hypothetical protein SEA_SWEATNTEARS_3 [Gordonia phage SweatNTears]
MTPLEKLEEAVREFAASQAEEQCDTLADWFLGFSVQQIAPGGDIQYAHGYAASENVYAGVGVAGVALAEAKEDLKNGEEGL